ncbi:hypothetical protein PF005_g16666 [Phytophthora fragariae]|uniref:Jacalin-type lectin domain-containing protein n=3 Tax=Phytophthora fragariae TaxID=53985 RepID=A0A6A3RIT6_9STRA|nr:hypothetical protein PF003_g1651 [Phytophthora fragariae]KAE8932457.1 hypothetical protein PF009_g17519 [Phytophthora fragariae]KAE8998291.1 hypothetical protein PF011_g15120 [Phytophthora fragariae]KAE9096602.1 hypothetical protein PF007_g16940 [Phytophthora fragariae]KAE9132905.1 hypothetical protein PF006_g15169 [Phytophthora fragariae]
MTPSIVVTNLQEDEVLSYPLVLLEGFVTNLHPHSSSSDLFLEARLDPLRSSLWPISAPSGHFKAFVLLPAVGQFAVTLRLAGATERVFCIEYRPRVTRYMVQFHYQICSDSDARDGFDAPPGVDNSDAAAIAKVRFNALVLQMATAELMHAAGLGRQTFAMQFAADGLPDVKLLRCSFTNAYARSVDGQELIHLVEEDIEATGVDDNVEFDLKHAVVLGCSRFNKKTGKAEGHTALGGGKVGVFGSCGLHTWPTHVGEISACCLNNNRIDQRHLLDDSCFRGTFWANFSTGIGAMLHEIGHTIGLGHATSGIMARGFDDMNRLLCVYQADPHSSQMGFNRASPQGWLELNHAAIREVVHREGAHWNAGSAQLLRHCPWISGYAQSSLIGPTVSWDDSVRGPVGHGQFNGTQVDLPERNPSMSEADEIGAVMIDAGKYANRLESFTRAQVSEMEKSEPLRAAGDKHWFVLVAGEHITRVEIRAMAWIDGLQLHTNLRSSRWFGGTGGTLHALQAADGWRVSSFFGTRGDSYVGKLGLRCLPISSPALSPRSEKLLANGTAISSFPPAGKALEDGPKTPFSITLPEIGAVVIQCGRFVESIRVLSPEEAAANSRDPKVYRSNEHVFELSPGEKLVKLEVYSGHWVDCVRFTTTLRVGPWFGGGRGPNYKVMECPAGHQICGLHGVLGKQYVGSLGSLYCADSGALEPLTKVVGTAESPTKSRLFWIMKMAQVSNETVVKAGQPPLGIVLATQGGAVTSVQSFDSAQQFDELVNQLHSSVIALGSPYQVHCVPLVPGEKLLQIDVSFRPASVSDLYTVIDGICFHTTTRCSSWFGAYREENLRFFMAPAGASVIQLGGVYTGGILTDLTGVVGTTEVNSSSFVPDGRVLTDSGAYDVRLEAASPDFGIQSVLLVDENKGDHRDQHAWTWKQEGPCPRVWRVPQRILEDQIEGIDRKATLFQEYLVGAIDSGGAYSKTPAPGRR